MNIVKGLLGLTFAAMLSATTALAGTAAPLAVTVHDLAFIHDPSKFSRQGVRTMNRSLGAIVRRADRVIVSSEATRRDCVAAGIASRLVEAMRRPGMPGPLVVAGAEGWGDVGIADSGDTRFLGFIPDVDLAALYAAATVFAYPSEREGFGLPVAEAMAQGAAVVTSKGTSTEEVAGGAAVRGR